MINVTLIDSILETLAIIPVLHESWVRYTKDKHKEQQPLEIPDRTRAIRVGVLIQ